MNEKWKFRVNYLPGTYIHISDNTFPEVLKLHNLNENAYPVFLHDMCDICTDVDESDAKQHELTVK